MRLIFVMMSVSAVLWANCLLLEEMKWRKTFVESTDGFTQEQRLSPFTTMRRCAMIASLFEWASLIYEEGGSCVVTDKQLQIVQEKDSINTIRCMTRLPEGSCVLQTGTVISDGEESRPFCDNMKCENGILINLDAVTTEPPGPQETCPSSFTIEEGLGCVKTIKSLKGWCDARKQCMSEGADLVQLDSYTDLNPLQSYCRGQGLDDDVWIGLRKFSGLDFFTSTIDNDRIHKDDITIWRHTEPNDGPGWICLRASEKDDFRLGDRNCENLYYFICEVPLVPN